MNITNGKKSKNKTQKIKNKTNKTFLSSKWKSVNAAEYSEVKVSTNISNFYSLYAPFKMEKNICVKIFEVWNTVLQEPQLNL